MLALNKPVKGRINNGKFMKIISMNCGPDPTWLVSSVDRALHRYRKGHGFKSPTSLRFLQAYFHYYLSSVR